MILTTEEITAIVENSKYWDYHFGYSECRAEDMARGVEAAILAKLNELEPMYFVESNIVTYALPEGVEK